MKRLHVAIIVSLVIGILAVVGFILYPERTPIPGAIKSQVTSTILVPKGLGYTVERGSVKYNKTDKLLTFNIKSNNREIAVVAEQPTPDQFVDIPNYASKFFEHAGEYKAFDSNLGTVHLLSPGKGINDAAAMNTKGTLMFVNAKTSLTEDDWRKLFRAFIVIQ